MRLVRALTLAGGTVAVTVAYTRGRRQTRWPNGRRRDVVPARGSTPIRWAIPLAAVVMRPALLGFDVGGLIGSIWDSAWGIADDIKNYVKSIVGQAVEWLLNAIQAVKDITDAAIHALAGTTDWLVQNATNAASAVAGVVVDTYEMLDAAFANFREQAKAMLEGAWDGLKDWVLDEIPGWIRGALGEAWDILQDLADFGLDGLRTLIGFIGGIGGNGLALLMDFVHDPIGFIWGLIAHLVDEAIAAAVDTLQLGWDAFWGLFWPLLARQLGLPEDPVDMIRAAKWLWTIALAVVSGDFEQAFRDSIKGAYGYTLDKVQTETHNYADLLVELLYEAMGIKVDRSVLVPAGG